jgi:hypothetical protein
MFGQSYSSKQEQKMKISELFDIQSYRRFNQEFCDHFKRYMIDTKNSTSFKDDGIVLQQNLKYIDPKIFQKKFPENALMNLGITVDNTGGYNDEIQSLRVIPTGQFRDVSDRSDGKGKIDIKGENSNIKVLERIADSDWTDSQAERASNQGINLQNQFVSAHNEQFQRELDEFGLLGFSGREGLLNNSDYTSNSASNTAANLSATDMYNEIADLIRDQHSTVQNIPQYKANVVLMATTVMNEYKSTILDTAGSHKSVLSALQTNFPDVQFVESHRANASNFNSGGSRTVAFSTSEEAMKYRLPVPLTISEIEQHLFQYYVASKFRAAGLDILEKNSGQILTGL